MFRVKHESYWVIFNDWVHYFDGGLNYLDSALQGLGVIFTLIRSSSDELDLRAIDQVVSNKVEERSQINLWLLLGILPFDFLLGQDLNKVQELLKIANILGDSSLGVLWVELIKQRFDFEFPWLNRLARKDIQVVFENLVWLDKDLIENLLDHLFALFRSLGWFGVAQDVLVNDLAREAHLVFDVLKDEAEKLLGSTLVEEFALLASLVRLFVLQDNLFQVVE